MGLLYGRNMKYRSREIVEAAQWRGDNQGEMKTFLGPSIVFGTERQTTRAFFVINNGEYTYRLEMGEWIVRLNSRLGPPYRHLSSPDFHTFYRKIDK